MILAKFLRMFCMCIGDLSSSVASFIAFSLVCANIYVIHNCDKLHLNCRHTHSNLLRKWHWKETAKRSHPQTLSHFKSLAILAAMIIMPSLHLRNLIRMLNKTDKNGTVTRLHKPAHEIDNRKPYQVPLYCASSYIEKADSI